MELDIGAPNANDSQAASTSTNSLPPRWDGIAGVAAILDVKLNGFADVGQSLGAIISLTDAPRQSRYAGNVATVFFLFQDDV